MNAPFSQIQRLGSLSTVLPRDTLVLLRFSGADHLNELFEYRIEALAATDAIDFDALIGTHATVEVIGRTGLRHFDGIITDAHWAGVGENGHRYNLTLRPWLWLASHRRNQRIFHNKTVVDILEELFADYAHLGSPAVDIRLTQNYPVLEYTVQYRESDLNFVRRQMERHAISFHFDHMMGNHTLVLTDDPLSHDMIGPRPYKSYDAHHQAEGEHFWEWAPGRNMTTGAVRLTDFNFKHPDQMMEVDQLGDAAYNNGQIESFDYPGDYLMQPEGQEVVRRRIMQERGGDQRNRATGDCISLGAGKRFTLTGDPVPGTGQDYICLSANYSLVSEAYGSGESGSDGYAFTGQYTTMPDTAPLASPRRTSAPVISGPQTAMVVGEGEIDCDEYGRILVRFHWDLDGANSMRCRVSQNWAGGGWGGMVIPRIGMEVLVQFLEGDPDKPVVIGNVFNGRHAPPYPLPANKSKMVIRSQTHEGAGFNELSFEDQAGREQIFMHGQKDHRIHINNDQDQTIGRNRTKHVGNDQSETVIHDKTIQIGNNHTETIDADKQLTVGGSHTENITGDMTLTVTGNRAETVESTRALTVTGDNTTTVTEGDDALIVNTGNQSTTVETGARHVSVLAAGQYTTVKDDILTISESGAIVMKAATSVIIEAPNIVLKSDDSNFIQISGGQIVIEGGATFINPRESAPDTDIGK